MHLPPALRHPASRSLLHFLLAFLVLGPGIGAATGFTGKDEFFLGLRTPMEMIDGNHWLVPFLDGAPRIRKPPLLYWLINLFSFATGLPVGRIDCVRPDTRTTPDSGTTTASPRASTPSST